MKLTQLFRKQMGLSQEMMSNYLGLAKSQLSMYEAGKRELPAATMAKLAEIAIFLEQNKFTDELEKEYLNKQDLEVKAFLNHQIKELEYKKLKEERLLESMQKKFRLNLALFQFALHLEKTKKTLAEVLLTQANNGIKQNGLLSQTKLELKLEGIKSQLDYLQSLK